MSYKKFSFPILFVLALWCLGGAPARAAGDPVLLGELVRPPFLGAVVLSSDGHFLAALQRRGDEPGLVVWRADKQVSEGDYLPYTRDDLNWISWVGGGRLLISLKKNGLVLYDAHMARLKPLIDHGGPRPEELPPILLSALPDDPTNILMQWEDPAMPGYPAVYKVDAIHGTSEKIIGAWSPVVRWWASPEGEVSLGEGFRGRRQLLFSRQADGSWGLINDRDFFDDPPLNMLAVEAGGATALVLSGHASDTRALWRMAVTDGTMLSRLASNEHFDMNAAILDPGTNMAVGASFYADAEEEIIWQAGHRAQVEQVAATLGVPRLSLVSASRDNRRQLYRGREEVAPPRYYLYDAETDTVQALPYDRETDNRPKILSHGVWIKLPKKAGTMHAVLTEPVGGSNGRAVVLVHGGPVRRVTADYNPLVSWLALNGYTVLQPNFRGSSGFGEAWRRAGYSEWGRDMQADVRTAAKWLVDNGLGRAGSMCVMGGSYGGYAALMSAIRDSDLFACAISLNGVTSLPLLVRFLEGHRFHLLTVPRIRGRMSDYLLRRRSPLNRADLIDMPLLMLHSTQDNNVPYEQGSLMAVQLKEENKDFNFITLKGAEHQLTRASDRRIYYQNALNFLDAHIGGHAKGSAR